MPHVQTLSPRPAFAHPSALALVCAFTGVCALWLGVISIRLHHPPSQILIAAGIFAPALVTLAALRLPNRSVLRYASLLGCLGLLILSANVILNVARGAELEGYIAIIVLALIIQSVLTFFTLARHGRPSAGA